MATNLNTSGRVLQDGGVGLDYGELALGIGLRFVHLIEGVIVIVAGIFIMRYARSYIKKIQVEHETQRMALNLLEKITSGFLVVVTFTLALKVIGLDITLIIGALTLGLSFGLKDIIRNYVSGILILFKSPFSIGDVVKIRSFTGKVERIDFQSTTLKTFDRKEVTIYNRDVLTQSLVNYSKDALRRVEVSVTLGHGSNTARALKIFDAVLENHPTVLKKPRYSVVFKKFSGNGVVILLRFWVQMPTNILRVRSEIALRIQESFDEQNLLSPYSRSVEFGEDVSMNEGRKTRLAAFYGMPALAAIAGTTQMETALATADQEFDDIDEPEV